MTFLPQSLDPGSNRTMQSYGIVTGDVLLVCANQNAHEQRKLSQGSKREAQVQGSQDEAVQDQQLLDQILNKVAFVGHVLRYAYLARLGYRVFRNLTVMPAACSVLSHHRPPTYKPCRHTRTRWDALTRTAAVR